MGSSGGPEASRSQQLVSKLPTRTSAERRRRRRRPRSEPERKPDQSRTRPTEAGSSMRAAVSRQRRRPRTIPKSRRRRRRSTHAEHILIVSGDRQEGGRATERTQSPCRTVPDLCRRHGFRSRHGADRVPVRHPAGSMHDTNKNMQRAVVYARSLNCCIKPQTGCIPEQEDGSLDRLGLHLAWRRVRAPAS